MTNTRRFLYFLLLYLSALSVGVAAQQVDSSSRVTELNLRKHIEYLASDKLEGRRTGEPGATLAAKYVAEMFGKIGLKPGFVSNNKKPSYLQPFPYVTGVELAKTGNEFLLHINYVGGRGSDLEEMGLVRPAGFSMNGSATAPIVFAGYGITAAEQKFDDYAEVEARGKIVFAFEGTPDSDNPHSPFGRFDARTKALIAKDHGAVGLLLISREDNFADDRLARLAYDQSLGESALPMFVMSREAGAKLLGIDGPSLKALEATTATGQNHNAVMNTSMAKWSPSVSFKINLEKKNAEAYNVVGILPGSDPVLKNEAIVIGAHYDHLGHGGAGSLDVNSTAIHHGADDNASGTAAVIELAREFAEAKNNKRTLICIAFSGEEEGLIGSNFYVNNPVFPLEKTVAMINLDMVGRLKDAKLTIGGIGTASEWKAIVSAKNLNPLALTKLNYPNLDQSNFGPNFQLQLNEDGFGPSDHSSFYGKKVPVLFLFTGTHNDYHKPSDTAEKINYEGLLHVVNYVGDIVRSIDQNPQRPTYTVAKSSPLGGRTGFNISLGTVPNYADSTDGLLLDGVRDNSPAAKAGVRPGDKVVKLAGKDIRNVMDYTYVLGEMKAGEEYEIIVLRGREKLTMKIVPVKR
jgi:aminopeptidase YwaD